MFNLNYLKRLEPVTTKPEPTMALTKPEPEEEPKHEELIFQQHQHEVVNFLLDSTSFPKVRVITNLVIEYITRDDNRVLNGKAQWEKAFDGVTMTGQTPPLPRAFDFYNFWFRNDVINPNKKNCETHSLYFRPTHISYMSNNKLITSRIDREVALQLIKRSGLVPNETLLSCKIEEVTTAGWRCMREPFCMKLPINPKLTPYEVQKEELIRYNKEHGIDYEIDVSLVDLIIDTTMSHFKQSRINFLLKEPIGPENHVAAVFDYPHCEFKIHTVKHLNQKETITHFPLVKYFRV
jgi:hypothetical protein